jgi:uncharacterized membrane protein
MSKKTRKKTSIRDLVMLGIFIALVAVMQVVSTYVSFGAFKITLTLIPIVVGGILLGPVKGTVLGVVFGIMVSIFSVTGADPGGAMVFAANPAVAWIFCILRGAAVGFFPALIYRAVAKKSDKAGCFVSAISAPIINTGIFIVGMLLFFMPVFNEWMQLNNYTNPLNYLIFGLCGINFIIEFSVAVVFSPAVALIVKAAKKSFGHSAF